MTEKMKEQNGTETPVEVTAEQLSILGYQPTAEWFDIRMYFQDTYYIDRGVVHLIDDLGQESAKTFADDIEFKVKVAERTLELFKDREYELPAASAAERVRLYSLPLGERVHNSILLSKLRMRSAVTR